MKVEDIYQAPQSEALPQTPIERTLSKQSLIGTVIGTFSAGIPSMLLYIMILNFDLFVLADIDIALFFIIPVLGFIIGITAKVCGGGIQKRHQLCCGAITLFLVIIANLFVQSHIGLFSSLIAVFVASYFSKIRLTEQEKVALLQWQEQNGQ